MTNNETNIENGGDSADVLAGDNEHSDNENDSGYEDTQPADSSDVITALKARIAALEQEVAVFNDKNLRLLADFENSKKNALKRESENIKYQGEKIFVDLLDIVDNFERALESASENGSPDSLKSGIELIYRNLLNVLAKWGLKAEEGIGKQFDPTIHNAISKIPLQDGQVEGTIVAELKKAYWYKDKVIRVAEVVVAG